jgi:carbon monoxide dehydrogenase subunit G
MKFHHEVLVRASRDVVWKFLDEETQAVAECLPGFVEYTDLGQKTFRVVVAQKIGHLGATFDLQAVVRDQKLLESMALVATGRSVKGARGDLRASAEVRLSESSGGTLVVLDSEVTLSGMLASLGQRVVTKHAEAVVEVFAKNIAERIQQRSPASD